jgi:uncharacterized protein (UPF0297 family)
MILYESYLIAYLTEKFSVIDLYHDMYLKEISRDTIKKNSVLYVDCEVFCNPANFELFLEATESIKSACWIVKIEYIYDVMKQAGYNVILEPYFHIIDEVLGFKLSNAQPILPDYKDKIYFNLNRNRNLQRDNIIDILTKKNLLQHGHVTANYLDEPFLNEHLIKDNLDHYVSNSTGFERCQRGNLVSSNINNFYHIAKKPGYISLIVETGNFPVYFKKFFPTEKTAIPFMTQRIPMILGNKGQISELEQEGFDVFRDLINHEYDNMHYYHKNKPLAMIEDNLDILKNKINISQYKNRLQKNYDFMVNIWLEKKLDALVSKIAQAI